MYPYHDRNYIIRYVSPKDLEEATDDLQAEIDQSSSEILVDGKVDPSLLPNTVVQTVNGTIPSQYLPSYVDDVVEVDSLPATGESGKIYIYDNKTYRWSGTEFVAIGVGDLVIGTATGTAYDGGKGTELETKVADLEAAVSDKLGVDDVAVWAKSEDPTLIPVEKLDDHAVKYSDFSYVPGRESDPVVRKTIQLANYDSISGMNVAGNDAANLIMMSKWDKVDIGSSRYPVNLNGSEFTLNDEKHIATTDQIPDVSNFATKDEIPSVEGLASTEYVDQKVDEIEVPDVSDLKANVQTVGDSVQIGQENKGLNLKSTGNIYSGVMVNSAGYVPVMTPYPGQDGRYVFQMRNHDSLSGVGTDGVTGGNLAMLSKFDVADFGSKNFHTNLNVKTDNGHNGRVTVNDDNEIAYLSDVPSLDGYATTQNVSDSIAAEASARDKAIETATSDLVHNTLTVAGKSLTGNIDLASTDLTDGDTLVNEEGLTTVLEDYAKKDEILNTVVDENKNEKLSQALPVRTLLPVQRTTDVSNKSEAAIFSEYFNPKVTDRGSLRTYLQSNIAYISYNFVSPGMKIYQYYKLPITMADIPDTGDIKIIAVGADVNNSDVITKFTFTITLNGDASSVHIEKKVLEN